MAPHGHGHDEEEPGENGDEHHGAAADELDPEEPQTPLWLPLLGAALFLLGLIAVVATPASPPAGAPPAPAVGAASAPAGATTVVAPVLRVPTPPAAR